MAHASGIGEGVQAKGRIRVIPFAPGPGAGPLVSFFLLSKCWWKKKEAENENDAGIFRRV